MTAYTITATAENKIAATLGKDISMSTMEVVPEAVLVYEGRLVHVFTRDGAYLETRLTDDPETVAAGEDFDWESLDR